MLVVVRFFLALLAQNGIAGTHLASRSQPVFTASQHPNVYIFETDEYGNRQTLTLPCPIDNPSSSVNYTWFRGNQKLPGSMVNGEGSLIIHNITEGEYASREGVGYYCIARDNIGFDVAIRSRTITVYYAYFNGFQRMATSDNSIIEVPIPVALNSDVALECDVLDAKPPPQIKWFDDLGEIQEDRLDNSIRFLDDRHYLYLRRLQAIHLERRYYCNITNVNLSQEVSAPTRYILIDNLTQGELIEYKQIRNHTAFVGNASFEFAYVGGAFGDNDVNGTINRLSANSEEVRVLGNVGIIDRISRFLSSPGIILLEASVSYNGLLSFETRSGTVIIHQVPRITNTNQNRKELHVGEGSFIYTCQYEGDPPPNITFYFNGAGISPGSGVTIAGNTLTIPSPQVSHSGIYQCIVSNEFGDDLQAWLQEIRQPILPQVQPYNFIELDAFDDRDLGVIFTKDNGSIVSFSMEVIADPCPRIVWKFSDTILNISDAIVFNDPCIEEARSHNWTFMLNVTMTRASSGSYSANLSNIAGTTTLPKPIYFTIPEPVFITNLTLNDSCLKEGATVALHCNIRGFPRPMIQFLLNEVVITPGVGDFENFVLEFYDQIAIMNVTMSAGGSYTCTTTRASGPQLRDTRMLAFCKEPVITGVNFTANPRIGDSFFIECIFNGMPIPESVTWGKDGEELSEIYNNVKIVPTDHSSRLEVTQATIMDNGIYECNISNIAGFASRQFPVKLQEADVPQNLSPEETVTIILAVILIVVCIVCLFLVFCCVYLLRTVRRYIDKQCINIARRTSII